MNHWQRKKMEANCSERSLEPLSVTQGNQDQARETDLQAKIRKSLKKHPVKPGVDSLGRPRMGVRQQYRTVAAEVGCSLGAVQAVAAADRAFEIGKQLRELPQVVALPFNKEVPSVTVQGFEGWVFAFARLNLMINGYLHVARIMRASMPAAWLEDLRDKSENAQRRCDEDARLKKLWPNGIPEGSGHLGECHPNRIVES